MDLTQSLFEWLKTFDLTVNCRSVKDLCDGVAISHVLNQICPEYFKTEWLNKIETDCGTNWRLRVSNLRKIYEVLVDFYSEELDKQIEDKLLPDVTLIGRDYSTEQLALLLQLILGCAINCHRKEHFIAIMTNLDLEVQLGIKTAIQRMETIDDINSISVVDNTSPPIDLSSNIDAKESALQRCAELEGIVNKLKNENLLLEIENEKLSEKLKVFQNCDTNRGQKDSLDSETVFQRLNQQIIALQTELSKTEELKEDYRLNSELREQEVNKLRQQLDQMMSKFSAFKQDRDELDRLRYLNEEVERYKSKDKIHKKKIEELKETKRQLQAIEDRNESLTKRICELEEDIKKLSVFKGQIDVYKKQKEDLRLKVGEEGYRADRAEEETKRIAKRFEELMQEKDKYVNELSDLRHELQYKGVNDISLEIDFSQYMNTNEYSVEESVPKCESNSTQMREQLIRLEFENQKLKERLNKSDDERVKLLESQLDDEKVRVVGIENENRLINQKMIKLEAELRDSVQTSDDEQMQTFQDIIKRKELSLETTKHELLDSQQVIASLKAIVAKKEEQLNEKEDQYKKCVIKAKAVLDQLSQQNVVSNTSISSVFDVSNDITNWKHLVQTEEETNPLMSMESKLMRYAFNSYLD